jgi:replicative DNA helicase
VSTLSAGHRTPCWDGEIVNLRLAKHRNGPTGEVKLWFKKSQTRFLSYAAERYAEAV